MKRKQLVKRARDIPDENIERDLTDNGHKIEDYFLLGQEGHYIVAHWSPDGTEQVLLMDDDDERDFATQQFLLRRGVPVYTDVNTPKIRPTSI